MLLKSTCLFLLVWILVAYINYEISSNIPIFIRLPSRKPKMSSSLLVTNRTITLNNRVYQIRNITSVGKYVKSPSFFVSMGFIIIGGFLGILCLGNYSEELLFLIWIGLILVGIAAIGILERFMKKKKYVLSIETNNGSARLIASENERKIDEIISGINKVMNNQDVPVNMTYNIADGDIINQGDIYGTGVYK